MEKTKYNKTKKKYLFDSISRLTNLKIYIASYYVNSTKQNSDY